MVPEASLGCPRPPPVADGIRRSSSPAPPGSSAAGGSNGEAEGQGYRVRGEERGGGWGVVLGTSVRISLLSHERPPHGGARCGDRMVQGDGRGTGLGITPVIYCIKVDMILEAMISRVQFILLQIIKILLCSTILCRYIVSWAVPLSPHIFSSFSSSYISPSWIIFSCPSSCKT